MPPEAVVFYLAPFVFIAVLLIAAFITGLFLTRGTKRVVGLWLAFGGAFLLVVLAVFVTIHFR